MCHWRGVATVSPYCSGDRCCGESHRSCVAHAGATTFHPMETRSYSRRHVRRSWEARIPSLLANRRRRSCARSMREPPARTRGPALTRRVRNRALDCSPKFYRRQRGVGPGGIGVHAPWRRPLQPQWVRSYENRRHNGSIGVHVYHWAVGSRLPTMSRSKHSSWKSSWHAVTEAIWLSPSR